MGLLFGNSPERSGRATPSREGLSLFGDKDPGFYKPKTVINETVRAKYEEEKKRQFGIDNPSNFQKLRNTAKSVVKGAPGAFIEAPNNLISGARSGLGFDNQRLRDLEKSSEINSRVVETILKAEKLGSITAAERAKAIDEIMGENRDIGVRAKEIGDAGSSRRIAAAGAEVILDIATAGTGGAAFKGARMAAKEAGKQAAKQASKQITKQAAKQLAKKAALGAAEGAAAGGFSALQQSEVDKESFVKSVLFGGAIGGGLVGGAGVVANKLNAKKAATKQAAKGNAIRKAIAAKQKSARTGKFSTDKAKSYYSKFKSAAIDDLAPIEDTIREGVKKGLLDRADLDNVSVQLNKSRRASNLASTFVEKSTLPDAVKGFSGKQLEEFDEYLKAKHATTLRSHGTKTGRDAATDAAIIKEAEQVLGWSGRQKDVVKFSQDLLDMSVESGLIDKNLAKGLKKKYPDYVPFDRIMDEDGAFKLGGGDASISTQSVVRKLEGSVREIKPPTQTLLERAGAIHGQVARNEAASASIDALEKIGVAKKIKGPVDGRHTISRFKNGVKETFEVPKELEVAAKSLDAEQLNFVMKALSVPTRIFKAGTTGLNPAFIIPNMIKDQLGSYILSEKGYRTHNPINFVGALYSYAKKDKLYKEALENGAIASFIDTTRDVSAKKVLDLSRKEQTILRKSIRVVNPKEWLRATENIAAWSENVTRLQNYRGIKNATGDVNRATLAAQRNSIDFFRGGSSAKTANIIFPYFNASIQGSRQLIKQLKEHPAATGAKIVTLLLLPSALLTARNLSNPESKRIYEALPEHVKEGNFILVTPGGVIKIPKPNGVGGLTRATDRIIEGMHDVDPQSLQDLAINLVGGLSPIDPEKPMSSLTPQAMKPLIETQANTNLFTGKRIENDLYKIDGKWTKREDVPIAQRTKLGAPETEKFIAEILGTSPAKVDHLVKGYGGDASRQILGLIDEARGIDSKADTLDRILGRFKVDEDLLEYYLKMNEEKD